MITVAIGIIGWNCTQIFSIQSQLSGQTASLSDVKDALKDAQDTISTIPAMKTEVDFLVRQKGYVIASDVADTTLQ